MLWEHWRKLRQAVALRGQDLEDRWNFLEFLRRADLAEAWIQEMVRPSWAGAKRGWGCRAERWGQGRACSSPGGSPSGKFPKPPPVPTLLQGLGALVLGLRAPPPDPHPSASTGGDGEPG